LATMARSTCRQRTITRFSSSWQRPCKKVTGLRKRTKRCIVEIRYNVAMSNFNFLNAKFPNDKLSNVIFVEQIFCRCYKMSKELLCRWLTLQKTYFVDVIKCQFDFNWATLFSDNYPLRGVLRLG
jgi:hypothetical protein